jgi:hypothetical protein
VGLLHKLYECILKSLGLPTKVTYNRDKDPIFHKYEDLDCRADELRRYWKPRDLLDIR